MSEFTVIRYKCVLPAS